MFEALEIEENVGLQEWTSWKVGGAAQFYCAPKNKEELGQALERAWFEKWPLTVLGGGTNVLISDHGVGGLVLHTYKLVGVEVLKENSNFVLEALCGTPKSTILKEFLKRHLSPAVFLAGLPGDVAGGAVMNAGVGGDSLSSMDWEGECGPSEFCEIVDSLDVLTLDSRGKVEERTFHRDEILWTYRRSENWQPGFIFSLRFLWPNEPDPTVLEKVRRANQRRKSSQPLNWPSCGSVFKNPQGAYAGELIESLGLKGRTLGGAQVSCKHGNFILNKGQAKAEDIHGLIELVIREVWEKLSISLTHEVVYLGQWTHKDQKNNL